MERLADALRRGGWTAAADALQSLRLPEFTESVLVLLLAMAAALAIHWALWRVVAARTQGRATLGARILRRAKRPTQLVAVLIALAVTVVQMPLPWQLDAAIRQISVVLIIVLLGWTGVVVTDLVTARMLRRFRLDTEDNLRARKYATQLRVLRRAALIVIVLVTAAAALMTFEGVRQYGVSLFASAGAAGLILGLAARPVLSNLIAGVQIALTQPIRIDDVVIVEGEWGWIEEIFATYVVVRIWDWRRMVVPLSFFIEQPFQNWTRDSANIIGTVHLYLDYTVPVQAVREKMEELVRASDNWDGQVVVLQVTDTDKDTMTLRGLMSARTSPRAWDLRCEVREKLLVWLQAEYPGALPRLRGEVTTFQQAAQQSH
jgi:small-conductance mechanosensitive channel